jgi:hypothetical protein
MLQAGALLQTTERVVTKGSQVKTVKLAIGSPMVAPSVVPNVMV